MRLKHGHSGHDWQSPTYSSWHQMIQRCTNPNAAGFYRYGGRGITVCDRWRNSFADFLADMGERPSCTSIDRINNDGNYEPGNCRWADKATQIANKTKYIVDLSGRRFGRLLVIDISHVGAGGYRWNCLCDCGSKKVVHRGHLLSGDTVSCGCRAYEVRHGQRPPSPHSKWLELNGERRTYGGWARKLGLSRQAFSRRLSSWPLEKALTTGATRATHRSAKVQP